jgi:hypothetical protein
MPERDTPDDLAEPSTTMVLDDDWDAEREDAPAPRRRRAGVTPAMVLLAAVLVAGLGFIGGVQVQKGRGDGTSATTGPPGGTNLPGGGANAGGGGQGAATEVTTGTVASKRGGSLYIETSDGTTVRVKTGDETDVVRTAKGTVGSVHPGDTVVIQGSKADDGTVTASRVTATADGVSAGGLGGGFTPPTGGQGGGQGPPQQGSGG